MDNWMAVPSIDTSDTAAYALLKRIAEKAVEPLLDDSNPEKTLGDLRKEMSGLLYEAVQFVATRNANVALKTPSAGS